MQTKEELEVLESLNTKSLEEIVKQEDIDSWSEREMELIKANEDFFDDMDDIL